MRMPLFYDHGFPKRGDVLLCLKRSDLDLIHVLAQYPPVGADYGDGGTAVDDVYRGAMLGQRGEDEHTAMPFARHALNPIRLPQGITEQSDDGVSLARLAIAQVEPVGRMIVFARVVLLVNNGEVGGFVCAPHRQGIRARRVEQGRHGVGMGIDGKGFGVVRRIMLCRLFECSKANFRMGVVGECRLFQLLRHRSVVVRHLHHGENAPIRVALRNDVVFRLAGGEEQEEEGEEMFHGECGEVDVEMSLHYSAWCAPTGQ